MSATDEKEKIVVVNTGKTIGDALHTLFDQIGCAALLIVFGLMGGCFDSVIKAWRHG